MMKTRRNMKKEKRSTRKTKGGFWPFDREPKELEKKVEEKDVKQKFSQEVKSGIVQPINYVKRTVFKKTVNTVEDRKKRDLFTNFVDKSLDKVKKNIKITDNNDKLYNKKLQNVEEKYNYDLDKLNSSIQNVNDDIKNKLDIYKVSELNHLNNLENKDKKDIYEGYKNLTNNERLNQIDITRDQIKTINTNFDIKKQEKEDSVDELVKNSNVECSEKLVDEIEKINSKIKDEINAVEKDDSFQENTSPGTENISFETISSIFNRPARPNRPAPVPPSVGGKGKRSSKKHDKKSHKK